MGIFGSVRVYSASVMVVSVVGVLLGRNAFGGRYLDLNDLATDGAAEPVVGVTSWSPPRGDNCGKSERYDKLKDNPLTN